MPSTDPDTTASTGSPPSATTGRAAVNGGLDRLNLVNAGYLLDLYDTYRADPSSVDAEWRAYFDAGRDGFEPVYAGTVPGGEGRRRGRSDRDVGARGGDTDQGPGRQAGAEHGGQPGGPDGHQLPRRRRRGARGPSTRAERADRSEEGELHPPDRLGDRPGRARAALDEPLLHDGRRPGVPRRSGPHQPRPGGRRRAQGWLAIPRRARHHRRRWDGLRRLPRPLRGARRAGADEQALARRLRRGHDHPDEPRDPGHDDERPAADAEPGDDRGDRGHSRASAASVG